MKTSRMYAVAILIACTLTMVPCSAFAANMNIGGTVWFAWWHFSLEDSIRAKIAPHSSLYNRFRMKPTFLYGPTISVDLPKGFGLSASFIYTNGYRIYARSVSILAPTDFIRDKYRISRYDLDSTFSYSPVRYFKIFTGFKFQGYDFTGRIQEMDMDGTGYRKNFITGRNRSLGAGLGFGITIPIVEGLHFQWNLSGLYLNMRFNYHGDFFKIETAPALYIPGAGDLKFWYHSYGGNTNVSLAYLISRISSTIILGFRYQLIYNIMYDLDVSDYILNIPFADALMAHASNRYLQQRGNNNKYDHFYGVSFAFVYSFELTKVDEDDEETE